MANILDGGGLIQEQSLAMCRNCWSLYRVLLVGALASLVSTTGYVGYKANQFYRGVDNNVCGTEDQKFLASPDTQAILVTYAVNCGATTPYDTRASIIQNGAQFLGDKTPAFMIVENKNDLRPRWIDGRHVELSLPVQDEVYLQETSVNGISIRYRR